MIAMSALPYLLFVSSEITTAFPTTRDPIGSMSEEEILRSVVIGIFGNMFLILCIPVLLACFWFVWGQILTKGRLLRDIEKFFNP
jgi:hypothetical protein